ncbi:MAG: hypothetical protein KGJ21_04480 [Pseudomonadota bacterium]|nr:hypothetical protein [Pseudomonadota bacterium]
MMVVLNSEFSEGRCTKIMEYLKLITAQNTMEISRQFNAASDNMAFRLAKESPLLLSAHAALWDAFKQTKQQTAT